MGSQTGGGSMEGSSVLDEISESLPRILCIFFGLLLSLYGHGFAPRSDSDKQLILGASRAPFFSGFVATSNLLWFLLSPSMATQDSMFFYHLALLVFGLGGIVGGVTMMIIPSIGARVLVGLSAAIAFIISGLLESMVAFPLCLTLSISTLLLSNKKSEDWMIVISSSIVGAFLVVCGCDGLLDGSFYSSITKISQNNWQRSEMSTALPYEVAWVLFSIIASVIQGSRLNLVSSSNTVPDRYLPVQPSAPAPPSASAFTPPVNQNSRPAPTGDFQAFNYVDPLNLTPRYKLLCENLLFRNADALLYYFGFQVDNVKGQVEHVLMLLANYSRSSSNSSVDSLHTKIFGNYKSWCKHLQVTPQFASPADPNDDGNIGGKPLDILLWFFIWGEAANLRHMPESLCFLYHKMMTSFKSRYNGTLEGGARYPGHFLDNTISPIYAVLKQSASVKKDHDEKRNFDDFNEFFWYKSLCLECCYSADPRSRPPKPQVFIADALAATKKSYLEKRSWFHLFLNFRRVYEFLIVTFQLLCCIGFGELLVWDWSYLVKICSSVLLSINFLHVVWFCMKVWIILPPKSKPAMDSAASSGLLLNMLSRYVLLLFQLLYYTWAMDDFNLLSDVSMRKQMYSMTQSSNEVDDNNYWWWQYIWISVLALSVHFFESLMQVFPFITSVLVTGGIRNSKSSEWLSAFLHIYFPMSRIYVGKQVIEKWSNAIVYQFYWLTLLIFKFWFGYYYLVSPMCSPTLELFDDQANYPKDYSFSTTVFLIVIRWIPAFLVYILDLSIWYSLWSGVVGMYVGMEEGLGVIQGFDELREHFMDLPSAYCSKLISVQALPSVTQETDTDQALRKRRRRSLANRLSPRVLSQGIASTLESVEAKLAPKARALPNFKSSLNLAQYSAEASNEARGGDTVKPKANETTSLLKSTTGGHEYLRSYVNEFLDSHGIKGRQWVVFAAAWNEIIDSMRAGDEISNSEKAMLQFDSFQGFAKPIYLPVFQTAGLVEQASAITSSAFINVANSISKQNAVMMQMGAADQVLTKLRSDVCMNEALAETWELSMWLLAELLGPAHTVDVASLKSIVMSWSENTLPSLTVTSPKSSSSNETDVEQGEEHELDAIPQIFHCLNVTALSRVCSSLTLLVKTMQKHLPKRSKAKSLSTQDDTAVAGNGTNTDVPKRPSSTSSLSTLASSGGAINSGLPLAFGVAGHGFKHYSLPSSKYQAVRDGEGEDQNEDEPIDTFRDSVRDNLRQLFDALRSTLKSPALLLPEYRAEAERLAESLSMMRQFEGGFFWDHDYASRQLDKLCEDSMVRSICAKLVGLLSVRKADAEPSSAEARRRLTFFVNSLFMDMPSAPAVPDMNSFSVMTPFYSEDVIYTKADLETENSDGVTVLLYLQTLYKDDWRNFLERLNIKNLSEIWSKANLMETRLWASLRAQTLARTVSGMMHYESALRLQAQLERVEHMEVDEVLRLKFSYVVAAQVYGKMKKSQDTKAEDIEWLLHRYPNLRVAYIDEKPIDRRGGAHFFSCLIKSAETLDGPKIQTVYRVKLPGNPCIGEGKPENQNHAVIFTRGEYMQAIDMNQDGFFEEALKHRNLLEEFKTSRKALPLTILGFREHIFTGDVSSLANYMALQEASFVTTGQRVLNRPLCIRLHYGHPDLFDKLFFMQNGGISKASKGINLSEDVFAGYANSVRGGSVEFKEYCQVGKGRDVGMMQIYKFEAKLAQGNAEQCLSRDVDRMANRLDFPRLLSYFFGGIGHYINSTITVFTIITVTYIIAFSALFGFEKVGDRAVVILGSIQVALAGMGILQTLPLLATLTVERGLSGACSELFRVFGSGGPFYFIFHIQTRAYYFFQTLIAGGAQYRATGRGFVTRHALFDENWRFFASSHMYLGFEILGALFVFRMYTKSNQFWGHCWSMFVGAMAFIWTPYWFNPLAFNWSAVRSDYSQWLLWMNSDGGSAAHSWHSWWKEEKGYMSRLRIAEKTTVLWRAAIYIVLSIGISGFKDLNSERITKFAHMVLISGGSLVGLLYVDWLGALGQSRCVPRPTALTRFLKIPLVVILITSFSFFISRDTFLLHMCGGVYYLCAAIYTVGVVTGVSGVAELLRIHDLICGHLMFIPLFALAALQLPDKIQTWLLYHNALSEGVLIDTILKQARRSQQAEEAQASTAALSASTPSDPTVIEMRRLLEEQQQLIKHLTRNIHAQQSSVSTGKSSSKSSGMQPSPALAPTTATVSPRMDPLQPSEAPTFDELPQPVPSTSIQEARQTTLGDNLVFRGAGPVG